MTIRAWICLKTSNTAESFEEAQTLLALARGLQDSPAVRDAPQVKIMIAFIDLCCYLQHFDPTQAQAKMKHMHDVLFVIPEASNWLVDGSFSVPVRKPSISYTRRNDGIVRIQEKGSLCLMFNWLPKDDVNTVGYLLSGLALTHQSKQRNHKAEEMFQVGISKIICKITPSSLDFSLHQQTIKTNLTLYHDHSFREPLFNSGGSSLPPTCIFI